MEQRRKEKLGRYRPLSYFLTRVPLLLSISHFRLCKIEFEEKITLLQNFFENYLFNYNFVPKHFGLI